MAYDYDTLFQIVAAARDDLHGDHEAVDEEVQAIIDGWKTLEDVTGVTDGK